MSASSYYSFIESSAKHGKGPISMKNSPISQEAAHQIELHRQSAMSPSSFATSTSNSSSSLNSQFNSLTQNSTASSGSSSSSSASSSSTSNSASSTASTTNLVNPPAGQFTVANSLRLIALNQRDALRQSSLTPTQTVNHRMHHSYTLHSLEPKPLKPFKSQSAYIEAMKEDLAEWLNSIYADLELTPENFFSELETGAIICRHANNVTQMGRNVMIERATNSDAASSGSENDTSLNHESGIIGDAALSSPSPEHEPGRYRSVTRNQNQFYQRHRRSTTNSSISSITTTCSSASKQRPSLTGSSIGSPRSDRIIDWFNIKLLTYKADARPGTFFARDNTCQFINWCRSLGVLECLLFETDDLVARKNEKSFILCLLEVARIGFKVGMPTPLIIQLEQEIDREIENDAKLEKRLDGEAQKHEDDEERRRQNKEDKSLVYLDDECEDSNNNGKNEAKGSELATQMERQLELNNYSDQDSTASEKLATQQNNKDGFCGEDFGPKPQLITNDLLSLHERVVQLLCQCTCPTQFPVVRIGDGKYKVGDKLIIFVRILRRHIMVRVGGGWQELSEFLRQKDPCRNKVQYQNYFNQQHCQTGADLKHETPPPPPQTPTPPAMGTTMITMNSTSIPVSRSRLLGSAHHLNKSHRIHRYTTSGGRASISGSASMSWLSHKS